MAPCLAVFASLFITIMAKSVKTSLDNVSGSQSSEQFWSNLFSEAQFLCKPSRVCEDRGQHPPVQTSSTKTLYWKSIAAKGHDLKKPVTVTSSLVGPKSHLQETNDATFSVLSCPVRAEGCGVVPRPPREFTVVDETLRLSSSKHCVKRSWRRAVQRAVSFGKVRYHGCWIRLKQISKEDIQQAKLSMPGSGHGTRRAKGTLPSPSNTSSSLNYLSVNLGGLPVSKFDELLHYGHSHSVDVLAVTETRRKPSMCWQSGAYRVIQSGEGDTAASNSYAGVMLAVAGKGDISYEEVVPGRILHVRLSPSCATTCSSPSRSSPPPLNIIAFYNKYLAQGPADDGDDTAVPLEVRSNLWSKLDSLIKSLPRRQGLLLLGDFNCHVPRHAPYVAEPEPSNNLSPDGDELLTLLERHDLRMQNTGCRHKAVTFSSSVQVPPRLGSRPDFVIIRSSMRRLASQVRVQWTLPFQTASLAGWHAALTGSLDTRWRCWRKGSSSQPSHVRLDQQAIRAALKPDHPQYIAFLSRIDSLLGKPLEVGQDEISHLNDVVVQAGNELFAAPPSRKRPPPWATSTVMQSCTLKWRCFRQLRSLVTPHHLHGYFTSWVVLTKHLLATRRHKQLCRQAREDWVSYVCSQAKLAASRCHHDFFRYVHMLAPKKRKDVPGVTRKLKDATCMSEERELFIDHFTKLFQTPAQSQVTIPNQWLWQPSPPTCDDLRPVFDKIPLFKAVPNGHALGSLWRLAFGSSGVRSRVDRVLEAFPNSGVPSQFRNGSLKLMHKPGKKGDEVSHYRPLVLQCPLGKAILKWVSARIFLHVRHLLLGHPQFAYIPGRSAEMAVHRVCSFLSWRKHAAGYVQIPAAWRMRGWKPPSCSGCIIVSLDLSNAFDLVDRECLFSYLEALALPQDLIQTIRAWHCDSEYSLHIGDAVTKIITSRGVRQGCTIAPLLWLIYLYSIVEELRSAYPVIEWLSLLTCYADDLILCIPIDHDKEVAKALDLVTCFLNHIRSKGLVVNLAKTQFFLKLIGTDSARMFRKVTSYRNGMQMLRLGEDLVPLSQTIDYLGVRLGWAKSADLTLDLRIRKGKYAMASLRSWWKRSALHPNAQVQLYVSTVLPVLTYGLASVGLTPRGRRKLETLVFRQLRSITRMPAHITLVSNESLLQKFDIIHPTVRVALSCCRLWKQMAITLSSSTCVAGKLDETLLLHSTCKTPWWHMIILGLRQLRASESLTEGAVKFADITAFLLSLDQCRLREVLHRKVLPMDRQSPLASKQPCAANDAHPSEYNCPDCGKSFPTYNQLRSHQHHSHCSWHKVTVDFRPELDCGRALPVCRWCGRSFHWWGALATHISKGHCEALHLRTGALEKIADSQPKFHLHLDLTQFCVICARWFPLTRSLSKHLKSAHPDAYAVAKAGYEATSFKGLVFKTNCPYCKATFKKSSNLLPHIKHHCLVLLQRFVAQCPDPLQRESHDDNDDDDADASSGLVQHGFDGSLRLSSNSSNSCSIAVLASGERTKCSVGSASGAQSKACTLGGATSTCRYGGGRDKECGGSSRQRQEQRQRQEGQGQRWRSWPPSRRILGGAGHLSYAVGQARPLSSGATSEQITSHRGCDTLGQMPRARHRGKLAGVLTRLEVNLQSRCNQNQRTSTHCLAEVHSRLAVPSPDRAHDSDRRAHPQQVPHQAELLRDHVGSQGEQDVAQAGRTDIEQRTVTKDIRGAEFAMPCGFGGTIEGV